MSTDSHHNVIRSRYTSYEGHIRYFNNYKQSPVLLKPNVIVPYIEQNYKIFAKKRQGYSILQEVFEGNRTYYENRTYTIKSDIIYLVTLGCIFQVTDDTYDTVVITDKENNTYISTEFIDSTFGKRFIKQFVPDLVQRGCKVIFVTKQFINDFTFRYPASYEFSSVSELVECNQRLTDEFKEKFKGQD